ncbi:MAG: hypothetical protein KKA73_18585 [Chloroflexi bacterium]|nr:hypothetical protein [Chloroflexota bacterium]MBU1749696.1 hypothetical protein [Chloroflexota bacterium]
MNRRTITISTLVALGVLWLTLLGCNLNREPPAPTSTRTPWSTFTPVAPPTSTPVPIATDTPAVTEQPTRRPPRETDTPTPTLPPTPTFTPTNTPRPRPTRTPAPTAAPMKGDTWDFEAGFVDWVCPYGDLTMGGGVGLGWYSLNPANPDQPENRWHSHFSENKDPITVHSGQRSQRISLEQVACDAYLLRTINTVPDHTYRVEAWGWFKSSKTNPLLYIGLDPTGGTDPKAGTVQWTVFSGSTGDSWLKGTAKVTAAKSLTIYLKVLRPVGESLLYGDTFFDDVSVWDEG